MKIAQLGLAILISQASASAFCQAPTPMQDYNAFLVGNGWISADQASVADFFAPTDEVGTFAESLKKLSSQGVNGNDIKSAVAAYNKADYQSAHNGLKPLVEESAKTQLAELAKAFDGSPGEQWMPVKTLISGALNDLGDMYYYGYGYEGKRDYAKAFASYELASKYKNPDATFNAGVMLYAGRGTPKDKKRAKELLHFASEQGHSTAEEVLAIVERPLIPIPFLN